MRNTMSVCWMSVWVAAVLVLGSCACVSADMVLYTVAADYVTSSPSETQRRGYAASYASSVSACSGLGGVPVALSTHDRINGATNALRNLLTLSYAYIGASAQPKVENSTCTQGKTVSDCEYRFTMGFNTRETSAGMPGVGFFRDIKAVPNWDDITYSTHQINGYNFLAKTAWGYESIAQPLPRGYFYLIMAVNTNDRDNTWHLIDSTATNDNTITTLTTGFSLLCEVQLYLDGTVQTTQLKQPVFRQTWKSLTWAQTYWWVIFIIPAIVVLAILVFIVVYCCCTRKEPPPGTPIHSMVVRERNGQLVTMEGAAKPSDASELYNGEDSMRYGHGFNQNPLQAHDGMDTMQRSASVYSNGGDAMVYHDTDLRAASSNVSQDRDHGTSDWQNNARIPRLGSKRGNTRRTGRTMSNTFSEVELPEGDEIRDDAMDI